MENYLMELPLQLSFRHMDHSTDIEAIVRQKAAQLDKFADRITRCRVVVEPAGKHHAHGNLYAVHIDLTVPGEEIVISGSPSEHTEHKDLHVCLRDAFDAARRKLEEYARRRRGDVKVHAEP
jgi:ribosome-associated translation inhibitor RaiA